VSAPSFRKVGEEVVYSGSRMQVVKATFEAPDGSTFTRDIIRHPGAVGVVPIVDEGTGALLVRQFRAPFARTILEIPAGLRDVPGEPPELTARRELEEEAGMRAGRMEHLCEFWNAAGGSDEITHVFMALDLDPCDLSPQSVEEQHMTIERISLDDVPSMIASGALADAKTVIGLLLAREALA
jgi:8-oxo-dGTP pyrophosphatase MutT (NUDIX family)